MSTAVSNPTASNAELPKKYIPDQHEDAVRQRWDDAGAFHADPAKVASGAKQPYTVLIPPPNVTARLHLGHALNNTLQDILVRAHRMMGFETLWMPGTDHAGIATQTVVDKRLKEAGQPALVDYKKQQLAEGTGRDAFIAKVQEWKDEYEAAITDQLKRMGCSCDWDRQRFTMDEICAKAVREAFFRLFKDGLIYRGKRLVNWDPVSQTALADDEVEMHDVEGIFAYMRYPLCDADGNAVKSPNGLEFVTVATTRPETYVGDTAVAMNPKDERAEDLKGLFVKLPFVGRVIPIITDDYVVLPDPESSDGKAKMATGFLKVTPAHDPNDWAIGERHNLPVINIMAPDASISDQHGWEDVGDASIFVGLSREDASQKVLDEFKKLDLLEKVVPHPHAVGHSYRSHAIIEPYLSDQWYCKVTDDRLRGSAQRALDANQRTEQSLQDWPESAPAITNNEPRPSGSGPTTAETAYLLTFSTYATWLHGDDRGSVSGDQNLPGEPYLPESEALQKAEKESAKGEPVVFDSNEERSIVAQAIAGVCAHRGWKLHACNVRTNYVHAVVVANNTPEKVMGDFKAYATRALRERAATVRERSGNAKDYENVWARHGSTRYLNTDDSFNAATKYVLDEQGSDLGGRLSRSEAQTIAGPLPHGRGSSEPTSTDGSMRFTPDRYAKNYETWHDNLKDWCISRQLWWGHQIPVWSHPRLNAKSFSEVAHLAEDPNIAGFDVYSDYNIQRAFNEADSETLGKEIPSDPFFVCVRPGYPEIETQLEEAGFTRDPDVLDTWFSSALWPLSTLGWPQQEVPVVAASKLATEAEGAGAISNVFTKRVGTWKAFIGEAGEESAQLIDTILPLRDAHKKDSSSPKLFYQLFREGDLRNFPTNAAALADPTEIQEATDLVCAVGLTKATPDSIPALLLKHGFVDTAGLLSAFNPTSMLATAREIITLWVSRMAMFNRYFLTTAEEGKEQAGPPPFKDVFIHAMIQDGEGRKMSKSLGNGVDPLDIIETHGTDALRFTLCQMATQTQDVRMPVERDEKTGKNTSPKFDAGRNFTTKLFNATKFACMQLGESEGGTSTAPINAADLSLVDQWMLSRLSATIEKANDAIANFQFSVLADALYDLLWRDFCDWYLESIKHTVKETPAQQAVLRQTLEAITRLLHPVMPYVTEVLSEALAGLERPQVAGLELTAGEAADFDNLLCRTPWPVAEGLANAEAEAKFEQVQALTDTLRQARANNNVAPRQKITLHAPAEVTALIEAAPGIIESLAGLETVTADAPAEGEPTAEARYEGHTLLLSGLTAGVDTDKLKGQLEEQIGKLKKDIGGLQGRLNNPGYVDKAPEHLVNQTRDQLAAKQAELTQVEERLAQLG